MAASDRPGGLTALSVLNGFFALTVGGTTIQRFMTSYDLMEVVEGEFQGRRRYRGYLQSLLDEGVTPWDMQILALIGLVATLLLSVSIWGLLKRSNLVGRWLGTLGGIALAAFYLLSINWLPDTILRGSGLSIARQLFYPFFLIFMLHVIFRRDFLFHPGRSG
ncbi:MAG: hypothetical protein CBC13_00500 [Planctomycetia bacterium TMED53]|nr:MAG: hypothetical protein CBC13_00500 [Planctomycetia bacterium TMED53]